jgi:dihydrofolate reductase
MTTIIAAIAANNALGKDNDLIWHLPADLVRFRKRTTGHHIIMGRNTYENHFPIEPPLSSQEISNTELLGV